MAVSVRSEECLAPRARVGWRGSFLSELTTASQEALIRGARLRAVATGSAVDRRLAAREAGAYLGLVVTGLLRTFRESPSRQVTVRYVSTGEVQGLAETIRPSAPVLSEALTDAEVLMLDASEFRRAVRSTPEDAWVVSQELVRLNHQALDLLCENVFLPIRQRVARHLLDLATRQDGAVVVPAGSVEVARAIGSVREVVARVLQRFRDERLVARDDRGLVLLDLAGLHQVVTEATDKSHARRR